MLIMLIIIVIIIIIINQFQKPAAFHKRNAAADPHMSADE